MQKLSYVPQPSDEMAPVATHRVRMADGSEMYLSAPDVALRAAIEGGVVFEVSEVVSMRPSPALVNPRFIMSVHELDLPEGVSA